MKKELVAELNKYLANVGVAYIKTHNLHWNVVGLSFKQTHEYLESLYDEYAEILDAVAELLKMFNEAPLASLKSYLEVADLKELEESAEIGEKEALKIALEDVLHLREEAYKARELAEGDTPSAIGLLEGNIAFYDKAQWFLKSMLK